MDVKRARPVSAMRIAKLLAVILAALISLATMGPWGLFAVLAAAGVAAAFRSPRGFHVCNRQGAPFTAIDKSSNASRSYPTCSACGKPQTS